MQVGKLAMHIFQAQSLLHTEVCSKNINSFLVLISDLFYVVGDIIVIAQETMTFIENLLVHAIYLTSLQTMLFQ